MSKVLIAGADAATRASWASRARAAGHEVYEAYDGLHALDLADEVRPDVVLAEALLPQLTGKEVVETLRANPEHRSMNDAMVIGGAETERLVMGLLGIAPVVDTAHDDPRNNSQGSVPSPVCVRPLPA